MGYIDEEREKNTRIEKEVLKELDDFMNSLTSMLKENSEDAKKVDGGKLLDASADVKPPSAEVAEIKPPARKKKTRWGMHHNTS